ncbi:MAG TPA: hydrolase, partial [Acidimicrobiia bacterium]|nr:hydrolase [Acidimicrobiia bacterium]
MAPAIERVVDAHIHLWDPANAEWYPYLAGQRELDMGDISGMCRLFDQPTYFAESSNWNVVKFVHVAAATAPHSGAETRHLQELADETGHPDA